MYIKSSFEQQAKELLSLTQTSKEKYESFQDYNKLEAFKRNLKYFLNMIIERRDSTSLNTMYLQRDDLLEDPDIRVYMEDYGAQKSDDSSYDFYLALLLNRLEVLRNRYLNQLNKLAACLSETISRENLELFIEFLQKTENLPVIRKICKLGKKFAQSPFNAYFKNPKLFEKSDAFDHFLKAIQCKLPA